MSTEGTVLSAWVMAVSEALDVPYTGKVKTMRALVEAVGEEWIPETMASELTRSRGGGNISVPAFQALLRGLTTQPTALRRSEVNAADIEFQLPPPNVIADVTALRAVRIRRGQPLFRFNLLRAYRWRCAVTACDAVPALEAAHITPYREGGAYSTSNGLLLRADVHTLFDLLLLTIDPETLHVVLHPELAGTMYTAELAGQRMRTPTAARDRPNRQALRNHRERCGF